MSDSPIPFPQKGASMDASAKARFHPGQIVWLKSGSPALTVGFPDARPNIVAVDWFDVDHCACRDVFHIDQLTDNPKCYPSSVVIPEIADILMRHRVDVVGKLDQDNEEVPSA